MRTLTQYEKLIKKNVIEIKDLNWRWSVHKVSADTALIKWGYLDYTNDTPNYFSIKLRSTEDENYPGEYMMTALNPDGRMITGLIVAEDPNPSWQQASFESAIKYLVESIADYAHTRY